MNTDSGLTLPTELTTKIFHYCLPAEPYITPSPKNAPLLLAQICHPWRDICLDTPGLWASIACEDCRGAVPIKLLKAWLSRARSHPISVLIHSWNVERATKLVRAVARHSSQLEDIYIDSPISVYKQLSGLAFPRLKHLVLTNYLYLDRTRRMRSVVIRDAPLLQHAMITNTCIPTLNSSLGQLTSLTLFAPRARITEHIAVLRCCPNLLDLDCGTEWLPASARSPPPELELSLLRSLKIPDAQLLPYLTAPLLERLEMPGKVCNVSAEALASFAARSRALQSLSMHVGVDAASVVPAQHMLRAAHSLTHLALSFIHHYDFEQLLPELQAMDVLPHLRRLELRGKLPTKPETYARLLEILKQRSGSGTLEVFGLLLLVSSLSSAEVGPPAPVMEVFRALAAGLHLRVTAREDARMGPHSTLLDSCSQSESASLLLKYSRWGQNSQS
ncbi:hypothetical protein C8R47DRAFT_510610 [Mycena vitilis]|nr:hypothetical protein C8R47DRAFT_510610 [Mycena vitilis]